MSFVRPRPLSRADERPGWRALIGLADAHDGAALDRLARAIRLLWLGWPLLVAIRWLLLGQLPGWDRLRDDGAVMALGIGLCLVDIALLAGLRLAAVSRLSPNRQMLLLAPLVGMAGALLTLLAGLAGLTGRGDAVALAILIPALLAATMTGRAPLLGAAYGLGAMIALAGRLPWAMHAAALLAFAAGVAGVALLAHRLDRQARAQTRAAGLSGEQARALLVDFEQAGHGWFWETDRAGKLTYLSETLAARLGRSARQLIGQPLTALIAPPDPGAQDEGGRSLGFHLSARTAFCDIAVQAAGVEGERWWAMSGQPVTTPFGQFMGFRGSGSDLTEMRRSQAEVARLARFDSLTGLANRMQMLATLEQALASRGGVAGTCALLLLDLDRFKEVNDTMGHPAGDALLRQVAQRLLRLVDTGGQVGRPGGDEFQIVLPGISERAELARIGHAIIHSLSQPYAIDGSQVVIGASIGVAVALADGSSAETLIRNADLALYVAKAEGRGLLRYYEPAMHEDAEDRRQLEQDLRHAMVTGGLALAYQPIVCASTERITGFEALIRWHHRVRGPISPAQFIPIAENAGLIGAIGEWVLRTACQDAATWPEGTRIAVNVSPLQFVNPALPALVVHALASAGLAADRLELEITEGVFLAGGADTDGMFAALKAIGVRLALDDFGTGYSALGYLKTAPFDKIKIDQSFVRGAAIRGSRNAAIVKSIVNLAEALGMETTAEGAETLDELALIRSLGCSHVQGYVYGRPADIDATRALLATGDGLAAATGHKASREPRRTMLRSVTLRHEGRDHPARIRNISRQGAMIEGLADVRVGATLQIELASGYVVSATCRWSLGERMGVAFEAAIEIGRLHGAAQAERQRDRHRATADTLDFYRSQWRHAGRRGTAGS
ncbi:MAG TPA: EAL domain-containing protein [Sphingobium sp.]|nr:EAL domain-containing protein [Sphingobium sp.]